MKSLRIVALWACVLALAAAEASLDEQWGLFKGHFGKRYISAEEERLRLQIFQENVDFIAAFNREEAAQRGYTLGVNQYADMTDFEFRQMMLGLRFNASDVFSRQSELGATVDVKDLPAEVDWRKQGAVTPVKDQGQCGSCWAFSTTGSIEGQTFRKTGKLLSLSEQQMVDCSWLNHGCNGGQMMLAYEYVKNNGGLELESDYPYKAVGGSCQFNKNAIAASVTGFHFVGVFSESALQKAVAEVGPISVAIDASGKDFRFYKSGVYNPASCGRFILDHGVLAVGYGTDNGQDYWLVKNSWNATWGQEGYFWLARNAGNKCGIATMATYPTV